MRSMRSSGLKRLPEVSVIVCHHKGNLVHKFIESCLKSLEISYEIIVITSDNTLAVDGIPGCIVCSGPQYPAAKRNAGAKIAKAQYLAFFDDDVEIEPLCLSYMFNFLRTNPDAGMVYGKLHKMDEPNRFDEAGGYLTWTGFIWSRAEQNEIDNGQYDKLEPILAGKSASCMIDANLFKKVGGFDEDFGILGEETDLSLRCWLRNRPVFYLPRARGTHAFNTRFKPAKEFYNSERVHYRGCRNYVVMLLKNLEKGTLWRMMPIHAGIWLCVGLMMICVLKIKQGLNILKGLGYCLVNLKTILAKRKVVQRKRIVSDKEMFKFIYAKPKASYYLQRVGRYLALGLHG